MRQFLGGPYDGHPLTGDDDEFPIHTFDMENDRMAIYQISEDGEFRFVGCEAADDFQNEPPDQ